MDYEELHAAFGGACCWCAACCTRLWGVPFAAAATVAVCSLPLPLLLLLQQCPAFGASARLLLPFVCRCVLLACCYRRVPHWHCVACDHWEAAAPTIPPPPSLLYCSGHPLAKGLADDAIAALPAVQLTSEAILGLHSSTCAVCLDAFGEGDTARVLPACSHCFHAACVDTWLASKAVCPVCRAQVEAPAAKGERSSSSAGEPSAAAL